MDAHVDYLIKNLSDDDFFRFNVDDYLTFHTISYKISNNKLDVNIFNKIGSNLDMNKIKSIYYRRPLLPIIIDKIEDNNIKQLLEKETMEFLRQYYYSFPDLKWLTNPYKIHLTKGRVNQLVFASKLGFKIPKTIVTNNKADFLTFFEECYRKVIIKSINPLSYTSKNGKKEGFYTEIIDDSNIKDIDFKLLSNSPTLFQEFIDSEYELRITSVDNQHFATKIVSSITDWRKQQAVVKYEEYSLSNDISILVTKYLNHYDLDFGCFDLIKGKDGQYYFLELNPNGQWLWLEVETEVPIGKAIINYLKGE
jgi:glutathione synthase/RimK-type ligase-like ATP-grasp enzyme